MVGPVSLFQNSEFGKASTDESLHLELPWARSCQYICVCRMLSKYSSWFTSLGQFSETDLGRTHNFIVISLAHLRSFIALSPGRKEQVFSILPMTHFLIT